MFETQVKRSFLRYAAAILSTAVVAGCASLGAGGKPEDQVSKRSEALLQARMSNDFKTAYKFTGPGYRALNTYDQFRLKYGNPLAVDGGKLVSVKCTEERCEVNRSYIATTPLMPGAQIPIGLTEVWIKQDGQWWWFVQ